MVKSHVVSSRYVFFCVLPRPGVVGRPACRAPGEVISGAAGALEGLWPLDGRSGEVILGEGGALDGLAFGEDDRRGIEVSDPAASSSIGLGLPSCGTSQGAGLLGLSGAADGRGGFLYGGSIANEGIPTQIVERKQTLALNGDNTNDRPDSISVDMRSAESVVLPWYLIWM